MGIARQTFLSGVGAVAAGAAIDQLVEVAAQRIPRARFGFFVALPLPDAGGSPHEIAHGLDVLKADGVGLFTSAGSCGRTRDRRAPGTEVRDADRHRPDDPARRDAGARATQDRAGFRTFAVRSTRRSRSTFAMLESRCRRWRGWTSISIACRSSRRIKSTRATFLARPGCGKSLAELPQ